MESLLSFEDLECWKACRQLRLFVMRKVVADLPAEEGFELGRQLRKAARSTTANIAEGFGRFHHRDNYKFCSNARGSLFETLDHLITANDDGYPDNGGFSQGRDLVATARCLLNGHMNYLRQAGPTGTTLREPIAGCGSDEDLIPWDANLVGAHPSRMESCLRP